MKIFYGVDAVPAGFGPSAVAVGKFDGVHVGHAEIVRRLVAHASADGCEAVVVTFDRNPLEILAPEACPADVMPLPRRCEIFAEAGASAVLVLPFTAEFAAEPPEVFVRRVLVEALGARVVLAGEGFRFGHRGLGDIALLRESGESLGFSVEAVPPVVVDGRPVSSTRIREALSAGDVELAGRLLGRAPEVSGAVVHGLARGRELGFPTANLGAAVVDGVAVEVTGFVPADGVYAGWAIPQADVGTLSAGVPVPAAMSVGTNPTYDDVPHTVEAHLLDVSADLYGSVMTLQFVSFLRPMRAFSGVDELVEWIGKDVASARIALGL